MKETGTLEEVMEKTFDLYMENRVSDFSLKRFLKKMDVFREEEILKLVEMLHRAKRGRPEDKEAKALNEVKLTGGQNEHF